VVAVPVRENDFTDLDALGCQDLFKGGDPFGLTFARVDEEAGGALPDNVRVCAW